MSTIEKAVEKMKRLRAEQSKEQSDITGNSSNKNNSLKQNNASYESQLCQLDHRFLSENGYINSDTDDNKLIEEYRIIKRPLLMNITGKGAEKPEHANIIMITSALPDEGKTYTAMNLALSMAMEKNTTVLLIDSDVVNPGLSRLLGISKEKGLLDLLLDETVKIPDVIYKTNIPKLNLIPAGQPHGHANELLASNQMKALVHELSTRYSDRVIILDAPPLLVTSHSSVLAHHAGQILFVTEAGKTLQHEITEAVSQFDDYKIVGLVLNKSRGMHGGDYNYGYYGAKTS
jgi:exopolysaccharide/PEP-CTERM locus tyrosine autokinase